MIPPLRFQVGEVEKDIYSKLTLSSANRSAYLVRVGEKIRMRTVHLPDIPLAATQSHEKCIELYSERLSANEARWPEVSVFLSAYLAWPGDEERRNSFVATYLARFRRTSEEIGSDSC